MNNIDEDASPKRTIGSKGGRRRIRLLLNAVFILTFSGSLKPRNIIIVEKFIRRALVLVLLMNY